MNNVGIAPSSGRVDSFDEQRLKEVFLNNVSSYFLCTKQAILRMSARYKGHGGIIINISSTASRPGSANKYIDMLPVKALWTL